MDRTSINSTNIIDRYSDQFPMIMSSMVRYNNRIRIKDENLAEHTFYVAYNILRLGYDLNISEQIVNRAVCMGITHDFPESYTSDLPHNCKAKYPELRTILGKIEDEFIKNEMPELNNYFVEYQNNSESVCTQLVELADAISVLQYCTREKKLGNKSSDFDIIYNEVCVRITHLYDKLIISLKDKKLMKKVK